MKWAEMPFPMTLNFYSISMVSSDLITFTDNFTITT